MTQTKTPQHIAFIMDGNGRWATALGKRRLEGHKQGIETVKAVLEAMIERAIPYATFYAFSTENWKRSTEEVNGLFSLMRTYFKKHMDELNEKGVRVRFIGNRSRDNTQKLARDILDIMDDVEAKTAQNTKVTAQFAINYSGRDELTRAIQHLVAQPPAAITPEVISHALDTAGLPDPDLLIRTSGEQRISNYLLWQLAYAEMIFHPHHWPAFTVADLDACLDQFAGRERRFGAVPPVGKE